MGVVGLIPAAGWAARLQPLGCSKEVLPVAGRPAMDHVIEQLEAAECDEIVVVTRPEKGDVAENAARHSARVVLARPPSLGASLRAGVEGLDGHDTVLIGYPDSLWRAPGAYLSLIELLDVGWTVALGVFRAPLADLRRYEPVVLAPDGRVERIEFKPADPSSEWTWGIAAMRAQVVQALPGDEPGVHFDRLARERRVAAVKLPGGYLDIGTHDGLERALAL